MSSGGAAIGGVVGAIGGFFLGGPIAGLTAFKGAMSGAQIGIMIGGYLDPPKGPQQATPETKDLTVQTATYGASRPRLYGTISVYANIFWLENNLIKVRVKKTKQGGGKGGPKATTIKTKTYYGTFAAGLCDCPSHPIAGIRRIWLGGKLWYDAGSADIDAVRASNAASELFTLHDGSNTQLADDRMQATIGAANTPAYRGLAYLVFNDLPLAPYGDTLMGLQIKVEVLSYSTKQPSAIERVMPSSGYWNQVSSTEQMLMALDDNSTTKGSISYDGATWEPIVIPTNASGNNYVVIGKEKRTFLVAEGNNYAKITDNGGLTWQSYPISGTPYSFVSGVYANSEYLLFPSDGAKCFRSPDGINWTEITLPVSKQWSRIIHNGSLYLAISNDLSNTCITSVDGVAWTVQTMVVSTRRYSVAWNGTTFCIPNEFGTAYETSSDGVTWASHSPVVVVSTREVLWNGAYFISCPNSTEYGSYSSDGITWTQITVSATSVNVWSAINFDGITVMLARNTAKAFTLTLYDQGLDETLATVVSSEVLQSKLLTAGDIDVAILASQTVRGYMVANVAALRSALDPLQGAWPFDIIQHGYKLQFKPRGTTSVVTIPEDDLDARAGGDTPGISITNSREMDIVLPRRVTMQYLDYSREYDVNTQYSERLNTDAVNVQSMDLALVLTSDEAARIVEILLYMYWLERYSIQFKVPAAKYNNLEPGDVVTVVTSNGSYALRLTQITYTADGLLECDAKYSRAATYVSTAVGGTPAAVTVTLAPPGYSEIVLMDIPLLDDTMNQAGYVAAMTGYSAGWKAGEIYRTDDGGASWSDVQAFASPGSYIGYASTSIGAGRTDIFDNANVLQVYFIQGAFSSVSELAVLNGSNYFAYGAHGRWEIIAAKTCVLQGDGSYKLSDLLRGRKGTEWTCGLHEAGDTVVALDNSSVIFVGASTSAIGISRAYRGVTDGQEISAVSDYEFTYSGVNLECYAPVYPLGNRSPITGDWTLTWVRRTRIGGEWRDYVDASLGESVESYGVDLYVDSARTILKRRIEASTQACTYTASQQTTDYGRLANDLYWKVCQKSADVGDGYPTLCTSTADSLEGYTATITVPAASVGAALTDFPLFLDLSLMSAAWWNSLWYRDGRDIRVLNSSGVAIPIDLVSLDAKNRTGYLFTKTNLSNTVPTVLTVRAGRSVDVKLDVADAIGRNNVWTNYHRVFTFGVDHSNRAGTGYLTDYVATGKADLLSTSRNIGVHQGIAWDGLYYYASDTNQITKFDDNWNVIAINSNPCGDVGNGVNHVGDIEVFNGIIYAPVEYYASISVFSGMRIARFNADTLAFIDSVSISAQGHEASSIAYCDKDGYLYVSSYANGGALWRYNITTLAYVSSLTVSPSISTIQGITWWRDAFFVNSGNDKTTYRVEYSGTVNGSIYSVTGVSDEYEGVGHTDEGLLILVDVIGSLHNGVVKTITPKVVGNINSVEFAGSIDQFEYLNGLTQYSVWTIGATVRLDSKAANAGIISYTVNGSSSNADRATLAYRLSSDRFGLWNDTDSWLLDTVSPVVGTAYRLNASHNGTSGRKIFRDGALTASAVSSTVRPAAGDSTIVFGMESWTKAEDLSGAIGYAYVSGNLLSDHYIAAESSNLANPGAFYTITG